MSSLNAVEMAMMQSPARAWSQRHVEMRMFRRLLARAGIDPSGRRILDAGCGSGLGLALIDEAFAPSRLVGFDLMPEQVERARRRGVRAELAVGDITAIDHPDASFDAAFVFGILHHVPAWRRGLVELARVLAPGGVLLVEELHGTFVGVQDAVIGTRHPAAARFDWTQFRGGLADAGFAIRAQAAVLPLAPIRSFCAVRERTAPPRRASRDVSEDRVPKPGDEAGRHAIVTSRQWPGTPAVGVGSAPCRGSW